MWDQFYDAEARHVRGGALEHEFQRLWPPGSELEPDTVSANDLVAVASGRGGQGFISDPAVRKAVEHRAMGLAMELYRQTFVRVDDVSHTCPYDLRCVGDGSEVRVEVKGSTGGADEIQLTIGEVENARATGWRTDLVLVSHIRVTIGAEGPQADGGRFGSSRGGCPVIAT